MKSDNQTAPSWFIQTIIKAQPTLEEQAAMRASLYKLNQYLSKLR